MRDYGTASWEGGDAECDHKGKPIPTSTGFNERYFGRPSSDGNKQDGMRREVFRDTCGKCGATRIDSQLGLEATIDEYVAKMVEVFREVRRVLRKDGTLWLNLGDRFNSPGPSNHGKSQVVHRGTDKAKWSQPATRFAPGLKPKDLIGIPWRVAFALQADGWYLRSDIIWCLSGGTWVYARTKKGDAPMMLRDVARLDPKTVKLWNGTKWTQVLGWSRTSRSADELELTLRSGERISCTRTHQFPTQRGLLRASEIVVGDILTRTTLPEPENLKRPEHIGMDAAWLAGLYLAEGSMSGDTIQLSGHATQTERFDKVKRIAESYGGSATCTTTGNVQSIRVYGKLLVALLAELVTGKTAKDKGLAPVCWRYGNDFLRSLLDGYLSGDGHFDKANNRWRLGFTRNYNLERDLRTLAARLDFKLTLKLTDTEGFGKSWKAFRGEIRFDCTGHHNEKDSAEVVAIGKSRCREVYDVGVEDEPHLFALASGILTHNSKPNPMPESVTDRPTKAHEYVFLLSKSARYYYDAAAIVEPYTKPLNRYGGDKKKTTDNLKGDNNPYASAHRERDMRPNPKGRNRRTVWTIPTQPFPEAHFATYPEKLVEPCILAGCPPGGIVLDPFVGSGTTLVVARKLGREGVGIELNPEYAAMAEKRLRGVTSALEGL